MRISETELKLRVALETAIEILEFEAPGKYTTTVNSLREAVTESKVAQHSISDLAAQHAKILMGGD